MSDVDIVIGARDKASRVIDSVAGKVSGGLSGAFAAFKPVAIGAAGALAGVGAAAATAKIAFDSLMESAERINELAKTANAIGASVGELQALQKVIARIGGTDTDTVNDALKEMQLRIGEMASGIGSQEQLDIMQQLGLDPRALSTAAPIEQFTALQEAISGVGNAAERASIADKLFGGDAEKILPVFNADAEQVASTLDGMANSAATLSDQQAAAVEQMRAEVAQASQTFEAIGLQLAAELAPVITLIAEQLSAWGPPLLDIASTVIPQMIDGLAVAVGYVEEFGEAAIRLAQMDIAGFMAMDEFGTAAARNVAAIDEMRAEAERAAEAARQQREEARALPPAIKQGSEEESNKTNAAQKTLETLRRQLAVLNSSEEAVKRHEQLATASNEAERQKIALLQQQIFARKQEAEIQKQQEQAEKERDRQRQRRQEEMQRQAERQKQEMQKQAEERQRIDEAVAGVDTTVQATQGRLLTRGGRSQPLDKVRKATEETVAQLKMLRRENEQRQRMKPMGNMARELVLVR